MNIVMVKKLAIASFLCRTIAINEIAQKKYLKSANERLRTLDSISFLQKLEWTKHLKSRYIIM